MFSFCEQSAGCCSRETFVLKYRRLSFFNISTSSSSRSSDEIKKGAEKILQLFFLREYKMSHILPLKYFFSALKIYCGADRTFNCKHEFLCEKALEDDNRKHVLQRESPHRSFFSLKKTCLYYIQYFSITLLSPNIFRWKKHFLESNQ